MAIIRDEVPSVSTAEGVVTVDITPIVEPIVDGALERLGDIGEAIPDVLLNRTEVDETFAGVVDSFEDTGLPDWMSAVEVFRSDELAAVQTGAADARQLGLGFSVLDDLGWLGERSTWRLTGPVWEDSCSLLAGLGWAASLFGINSVVGSITGGLESSEAASVAQRLFDGITGGLEGLLVALIATAGTGTLAVMGWALYRAASGGQPE